MTDNEFDGFQIEGLINDIDFRHKVTREVFEGLCTDLFDRVSKPVTDAFLASQITEVSRVLNDLKFFS